MPSMINEVVFSEPSGRPSSTVQFTGAVIFLGLYSYTWIEGNGNPSNWLLFMIIGSFLSGIAESLPKNRKFTAGIVRLTAITVLMCLLAIIFLVPDFVVR